jgi:hypothetical protein
MYHMSDNRDRVSRDRDQRDDRDTVTRVVMDAHGNEWTVREVETPQLWAHGERCLIFSSSSIVRRLWSYPREWARLSSRELLDLVGDSSQPG